MAAAQRAPAGAAGLRAGHLGGGALGLAGVTALFAGRGEFAFAAGAMPGYLAALAAFVWAGYSELSARVGAVPTDAVAGFCLACGLIVLDAVVAVRASRAQLASDAASGASPAAPSRTRRS